MIIYIHHRLYTVRGKNLEVANLANNVQFAKNFLANCNSYKYSEITEDLVPADSPKFSSPFASSVMIRQNYSLQNFPTYDTLTVWVRP